MRSNAFRILLLAAGALAPLGAAVADGINTDNPPPFNPCTPNAALCTINICPGPMCTTNPPSTPPPIPTPSTAAQDEAKRAISMSEQHKFVDPLAHDKSGGMIQFVTPIKNKKDKTCS